MFFYSLFPIPYALRGTPYPPYLFSNFADYMNHHGINKMQVMLIHNLPHGEIRPLKITGKIRFFAKNPPKRTKGANRNPAAPFAFLLSQIITRGCRSRSLSTLPSGVSTVPSAAAAHPSAWGQSLNLP